MRFRKALALLIAFSLVIGAPASAIAMPAGGDCNAPTLSVLHSDDCAELLCVPASFALASPSNFVPEDFSSTVCSAAAFPPLAHVRAPDPAPPKRTAA